MSRAKQSPETRPHCPRLTSSKTDTSTTRYMSRSALTLVEILIALTMTLIVLGAMAQAFKFASDEIADGRAVLEMSNRLRNAQQLLRTDLAGLTVDVRPHTDSAPNGYFEYVDGPRTDKRTLDPALLPGNGFLGDWDDILAFTSRNLDGSFRGRFGGQTMQSTYAEIVWFTEVLDLNSDGVWHDGDSNPLYNDTVALFRRVLLIRPDLNEPLVNSLGLPEVDDDGNQLVGLYVADDSEDAAMRFSLNDVSARTVLLSDGRLLVTANSLSDLARRENRFARNSAVFPHSIDRVLLTNTKMGAMSGFSGDDILLTDVAGFDVKVYSPNAPVELVDIDGDGILETAVNTFDVGYVGSSFTNDGGFVDLEAIGGAFDSSEPRFVTRPTGRSNLRVANPDFGNDVTYCTWSPHYEVDGIDQDNDGTVDQGTDGLDNDNRNGVDDDDEKEVSPPYPYPVRGIKVSFRIIEKKSKQIRQSSVIQNFLPQ